jgi:hypothetical protein
MLASGKYNIRYLGSLAVVDRRHDVFEGFNDGHRGRSTFDVHYCRSTSQPTKSLIGLDHVLARNLGDRHKTFDVSATCP